MTVRRPKPSELLQGSPHPLIASPHPLIVTTAPTPHIVTKAPHAHPTSRFLIDAHDAAPAHHHHRFLSLCLIHPVHDLCTRAMFDSDDRRQRYLFVPLSSSGPTCSHHYNFDCQRIILYRCDLSWAAIIIHV